MVFAVAYKPLKKYLTGEDLPRASAAAQKAQADKEDKTPTGIPSANFAIFSLPCRYTLSALRLCAGT